MKKVSVLINLTFLLSLLINPLSAQIIMYVPQGCVIDNLTGRGIVGATEVSVSNLNAGIRLL